MRPPYNLFTGVVNSLEGTADFTRFTAAELIFSLRLINPTNYSMLSGVLTIDSFASIPQDKGSNV